ncbi:SET domain-containing protein-lysine N-methyltransferase [Streptomyces wuyuanensis]|uniref:SET domain-containing protein n=1 Tax=Streptomyces wuyuanensis TaxID=1196353 RepID=A0A1G9MM21_9ACTN|nr:SET domain-containing protein-lysine N-methyltransferase [Streptomyces wuyuanensis]SDL75336.1 SET domain-containing protein [Streptomyces wuyuanensis]
MPRNDLMDTATLPSGEKGYVARQDVPAGAVVGSWEESAVDSEPTKFTIQVGRDRHVDADAVRYLNHSCVPSTFVDASTGSVVALRPLAAGDALTFFYPSTEWEMTTPFDCACGHAGCLGKITGAEALSADVLRRYAVNDHIRALVADRDAVAVD